MPGIADTALVHPPQRTADAARLYDRLAPHYDRLHRRWLRAGGAQALAAVQGCLAAELRPGLRVLDAGCGTGELGRWMLAQEPRVRLALLDAAPAMLERAARAGRAGRVRGSLAALPFATGAFDLVVCTWALETLEEPRQALAELDRTLAPGGLLCCCFCTDPTDRWTRLRSLPLRWAVTHLFGGRFLPPAFPPGWPAPAHGGRAPRRLGCHGGLSTFVCHRKPGRDDAP